MSGPLINLLSNDRRAGPLSHHTAPLSASLSWTFNTPFNFLFSSSNLISLSRRSMCICQSTWCLISTLTCNLLVFFFYVSSPVIPTFPIISLWSVISLYLCPLILPRVSHYSSLLSALSRTASVPWVEKDTPWHQGSLFWGCSRTKGDETNCGSLNVCIWPLILIACFVKLPVKRKRGGRY